MSYKMDKYSSTNAKCRLESNGGDVNCQNIPNNLGKDIKFKIIDLPPMQNIKTIINSLITFL